jgi:hypothetical protein
MRSLRTLHFLSALIVVLSLAISQRSVFAVPLTYNYTGITMSGSSPYHGNYLSATVTFKNDSLSPLSGAGGTLGTGDIDSFSISVPGASQVMTSALASWVGPNSFTFDTNLEIVSWYLLVEQDVYAGGNPEQFFTHPTIDIVGAQDASPNDTNWNYGGGVFAAVSDSPGQWTVVPEPQAACLAVLSAMGLWCWRKGTAVHAMHEK